MGDKDRDNKDAVKTGANRADFVKDSNKTPSKNSKNKDKDPDRDKNDNNKGKRKGFTMGQHKGRH